MGLFTDLAGDLLERCQKLDAWLEEKGTPSPKWTAGDDAALFDANDILEDCPAPISKLRVGVAQDAQTLCDLCCDPRHLIRRTAFSSADLLALQTIAQYKLAELVPPYGRATFAELAKASGADEDTIRRALQMSSTKRVFRQVSSDEVCHTAASRLMVEGPLAQGMVDEVSLMANELAPAAGCTLKALRRWPDKDNGAYTEPNKTGFNLAFDTNDSFYVELSKTPERMRAFGGAMRHMNSGIAYGDWLLVEKFDWAPLAKRGATVVDVGGGQGGMIRDVEKAHPGLNCIVQDLTATLQGGSASLPPDKRNAIHFEDHDFFTPQKRQADVFVMRWILHNWSDKYAAQIVKNLIPGMKPGSKIVVYEYLIAEIAQAGSLYDYYRRVMDVAMTACFAAKERTIAAYVRLFQSVDPRFRLAQTIEDPESAHGIVVMELGDGD